jgi:hypothetical protein
MKRIIPSLLFAFALAGAAGLSAVNCGSSGYTYDYGYESAYVYDYYYPADAMYYTYYWTDPWASGYYYYLPPGIGESAAVIGGAGGSDGGSSGDAGATTDAGSGANNARQAIGDALRALARGENPCPNQNTVTPKQGQPACRTDGNNVTMGATLTFAGCQLANNGGTLDGTIDIQATSTASEAVCSAATVVTVMSTTTITNFTYTNAAGNKVVIPNLTSTGTNNLTFGQPPASLMTTVNGRIQIFGSGNTLLSDHTLNGLLTFTPSADHNSFSIDGTLNVMDPRDSSSATSTVTGLTRTSTCCRPTAGMLKIVRTGGTHPGTFNWTFGPTCGAATVNGNGQTLPACQ